LHVATSAYDSDYEDEAAKAPISLHPAFPAIVALWFSALLGVGSLVLPAVLLDSVVAGTGLASLIPAASPPLGMTARGLIAVVGALLGAGVGVAVARRVALSHRPQGESRIAKLAGASRRPISVHEELGGANGLPGVVNGESLPISRRRALAISEDDRPSDFLYRAPLPGAEPGAPTPFAEAAIDICVDQAARELNELAEDAEPASPGDEKAHEDHPMTDIRHPGAAWPTEQHHPKAVEQIPADAIEARKNPAGARVLEALPFCAPSLARKAPEPEVEPELEAKFELETVVAAAAPEPGEPDLRADWQTAPLDGLGLVQLVQRLGSTIERRREMRAQAPVPAAVSATPPSAPPADFEPAPAEEAAQAMAAFFAPNPPDEADESPPPAIPRPGFLQPLVAEDDELGDDPVPDFSLPMRRPVAAAPAFAPLDDDDEAAQESDDGYSSLLGMSSPFAVPKSEFVRIEEPEAVDEFVEPAAVFPVQPDPARFADSPAAASSRQFDPPADAGAPTAALPTASPNADAALRAALATLQRMSGAA
jgi:hypothetical protein